MKFRQACETAHVRRRAKEQLKMDLAYKEMDTDKRPNSLTAIEYVTIIKKNDRGRVSTTDVKKIFQTNCKLTVTLAT